MRRGRMRAGMNEDIIGWENLPASLLDRIKGGILIQRDGDEWTRFRPALAGRTDAGEPYIVDSDCTDHWIGDGSAFPDPDAVLPEAVRREPEPGDLIRLHKTGDLAACGRQSQEPPTARPGQRGRAPAGRHGGRLGAPRTRKARRLTPVNVWAWTLLGVAVRPTIPASMRRTGLDRSGAWTGRHGLVRCKLVCSGLQAILAGGRSTSHAIMGLLGSRFVGRMRTRYALERGP